MLKLNLFLFSTLFLIITSCKKKVEPAPATPPGKAIKTQPCDNPKTIAQLLACANTIGKVTSSTFSLGSKFNGTDCLKAWNDQDTVLTITYADSILVWRVSEWPEVTNHLSGHWFTNYSAKNKGLTKSTTIDLFALNNCSNFDWKNCTCNGHVMPADTIIQYEDLVKVGGGENLHFGVVGKNQFGKGGQMQWNLVSKNDPPFRLINQEKW